MEETELVATLRAEIDELKIELETQKTISRDMWKLNCEQLMEMDNTLCEKHEEINRLRRSSPSTGSMVLKASDQALEDAQSLLSSYHRARHGKAPPVYIFTGADPDRRLDDWLPTLKRAAVWNGWTDDDLLIQLAGHLKGRALQEWDLLSDDEKRTYEVAVAALRSRLDHGSKVLAAQDFVTLPRKKTRKLRISSDGSRDCFS